MSPRLVLALQNGLSLSQPLTVIGPVPDHNLSALPADAQVVQPFKPFHDHFAAQGFDTVPEADAPCQDAIVFLPRAKALARAMIQRACSRAAGVVVVDGAKTDGVDSILKDVRKRVDVVGPLSKAHGKIFWFQADASAFEDWAAPTAQMVGGFHTAPGVFSADGIDPASAMLLKSLPSKLGARVADLGAGWGFLSADVLKRDDVKSLHLVEADQTALTCARKNASDPRAQFYWADAVTWTAPEPIDTVVMNPPFHTSRNADPALGQGFIVSAARNLTRNGTLWMVANRHLPYETTLNEHFAQVTEIAGDNRFKVLQASRPRR
ncbi:MULTISPECIES: class I SAM-dependent methyltransferase [unclassified Ruegeria]|uniref:class I SAM-dependent methyltransferase n=1 Tax=unclassified Ruegeria TaxID=2625375 RepID=UPI001489AE57|nr:MULTISPECIES: class I SAM-dependent methyltransferase [unclassified Ruegeria]NOD78928.1 methyltransferase [Ruegeria sp. HKCCD4332]NOD89434.1 methyltransferase [Ruegeria sp. HKCCD4318]NOE16478.1 methyltransferase [Ruegeria sp. HKCCD4318-2]NOG07848.1 class I SAM-dependent methyltransferase [Ruegeria sp. HKCCD4315]